LATLARWGTQVCRFSIIIWRDALITASQTLSCWTWRRPRNANCVSGIPGKPKMSGAKKPGKLLHELRLEMARCQEIPHTLTTELLMLLPMADASMRNTMPDSWPGNAWATVGLTLQWIGLIVIPAPETGYLGYFQIAARSAAQIGGKTSDCIVNSKGHDRALPCVKCKYYAVCSEKSVRRKYGWKKSGLTLWPIQEEAKKPQRAFFNQDWCQIRGYFALGLDGEGNQDSIKPRPHLGVFFTPEVLYSVSERLRAPDMFNGLGYLHIK